MRLYLVHFGRLPGMNEMINTNRTNRYLGSKVKTGWTHELSNEFALQAAGRKMSKHATAFLYFFEKDNRRDDDNVIGGGCKVVLDALTNAGIIEDDSPKWLHVVPERFTISGSKEQKEKLARIEIWLVEDGDEENENCEEILRQRRTSGSAEEEVQNLREDLQTVQERSGDGESCGD